MSEKPLPENPKDSGKLPLVALTPEPTTQRQLAIIDAWRAVTPRPGESYRWEGTDERWVAVSLDENATAIVVTGSAGQHEICDSFERALELARSWRVPLPDHLI